MPHIPESHLDLLDSAVATLATIGPDGGPQLTEVWFLREGDSVALSLNTDRQKLKNLKAQPRCSLLILDLANPMRYLEIRGEAVITPDDDYSLAEQVGQKYGADLRAYDGPDDQRVAVRIVPGKVHAVNMGG
jgi:PPOX class probable F420-dependent enzyme